MKTPFTTEQFLDVFREYNESVFPLQLLFYMMALLSIFLVIKPVEKSSRIISSVLGFYWLWMGVAYHWISFSSINKAAYVFGALFIVQGILFLVYGSFQNKI